MTGTAGTVPAGRQEAVGRSEGDRPLPVLPALEPLFPAGGLRRGSAVAVRGSASLLLALLAEPSRRGAWCGVVGLPGLGLVAAAEAGIALERLALVPDPGRDWAAVAAALLDAMEVVVVAPRGRVPDPDVRRLAARARQRGAVLVPFGSVPWPGAEVRLSLAGAVWEGLGDGSGRLRSRRVVVRGEGRGSAARGSELVLWLPAPDGEIRAVPALHALPTPPDLSPTPAPTAHLHAVPDLPPVAPPLRPLPAETAAADLPPVPPPLRPLPAETTAADLPPVSPPLRPLPAETTAADLPPVPPPLRPLPAETTAADEVGITAITIAEVTAPAGGTAAGRTPVLRTSPDGGEVARTAETDRAAGTARAAGTDRAAGTARAAGTDKAAGTARAAGTDKAAGTARAAGTDKAAGTARAAGTAGTTGMAALRASGRRTSSPGGPGEPEEIVATPTIAALWQDVTRRPGARPPAGRRADPTVHPRPTAPPRRTPHPAAAPRAGAAASPADGSRPRPAGSPVPAGRPAPVGGGSPATPPPTAGPRPAIPADVLARLRPASTLPKPPPKAPPTPPPEPAARPARGG